MTLPPIKGAVVCAALLLACLGVAAQDVKSSVVTVERMLAIDALQAEKKYTEEAMKAGLIEEKKIVVVAGPKPIPKWAVRSIFGAQSNLLADISVDGVVHHSVAPGASIGSCKIKSIQESCVSIQPPKNKKGKTLKGVCPEQVCWTGEELTAEMRASQSASPSLSVTPPVPAASPIPIPAGSAGMPQPLPARR